MEEFGLTSKPEGLKIIDELGLPYPPYALLQPDEYSTAAVQSLLREIGIPRMKDDRWGVVIRLSNNSTIDKGLPHGTLHLLEEAAIMTETESFWRTYGPSVTIIIQHTVDAKCSGTVLKTEGCVLEAVGGDAPLLLDGRVRSTERWQLLPTLRLLSRNSLESELISASEMVVLNKFVDRLPQNSYLEWSLSKRGNFYFYEYSRLKAYNPERLDTSGFYPLARGLGASPGVALGTILQVCSASDLEKVGHQNIIVVETAGANFLNAVATAAGTVSKLGGMTSHGAVIAREFGRPFVVQVLNAFDILKNGMEVMIDGSSGTIMMRRAN